MKCSRLRKTVALLLVGIASLTLPYAHTSADGQKLSSDYEAIPAPCLPQVFAEAAAAWDVPVELLLTLGWMGSGFEDRGDQPTLEGGRGLMALRSNAWFPDDLSLAADLIGVDPARIVRDRSANIHGAAALLDHFARLADIDRTQGLDAWRDVVARYAALDADSSRLFAADAFARIAHGFTITNSRNETFTVESMRVSVESPIDTSPTLQPMHADYPSAIWDPAPECNYTPIPYDKNAIVIHMLEGTVAGALAQFKQCTTQASVHYIVAQSGTIWQMVREPHVAWHVGCDENRTIGIAHEGYSTSPSHPEALYRSSARLAKDICQRRGIPRRVITHSGAGIIGHDGLNACCCFGPETDPGPGWDWDGYLNRINDGQPAPVIVSAYSRKVHHSAGDCDLDLAGGTAVEARKGGPTRLVVTFDQPIEGVEGLSHDDVRLSAGRVASLSIAGSQLTIETRDVPDASRLTVDFPGIAAVGGPFVTGSVRLGVLEGDADGNGRVEMADMHRVHDELLQPVTDRNSQQDLSVTGSISVTDMVIVRNRLGNTLPDEEP